MTGTFPEFSGQESMQFVLEAAELVAADTGIGGELSLSPPPRLSLLGTCRQFVANLH